MFFSGPEGKRKRKAEKDGAEGEGEGESDGTERRMGGGETTTTVSHVKQVRLKNRLLYDFLDFRPFVCTYVCDIRSFFPFLPPFSFSPPFFLLFFRIIDTYITKSEKDKRLSNQCARGRGRGVYGMQHKSENEKRGRKKEEENIEGDGRGVK